MLKQHSFSNPFSSIKDKFVKNGRSNSAPGDINIYVERKRVGGRLPSLSEDEGEADQPSSGVGEKEEERDMKPQINVKWNIQNSSLAQQNTPS